MSQDIATFATTDTDVGRKVDRAVELNRLIEASTKELDQLKAELREIAKLGIYPATATGSIEIRSQFTSNCATICYQKDTPFLMKGADIESVVGQLTISQFDLMFRRIVAMQPVDRFEASFKLLPKKVQRLVRKVVTWIPNTPQVKLSK